MADNVLERKLLQRLKDVVRSKHGDYRPLSAGERWVVQNYLTHLSAILCKELQMSANLSLIGPEEKQSSAPEQRRDVNQSELAQSGYVMLKLKLLSSSLTIYLPGYLLQSMSDSVLKSLYRAIGIDGVMAPIDLTAVRYFIAAMICRSEILHHQRIVIDELQQCSIPAEVGDRQLVINVCVGNRRGQMLVKGDEILWEQLTRSGRLAPVSLRHLGQVHTRWKVVCRCGVSSITQILKLQPGDRWMLSSVDLQQVQLGPTVRITYNKGSQVSRGIRSAHKSGGGPECSMLVGPGTRRGVLVLECC